MYRGLILFLAFVATSNGKVVPTLPMLDGRIVGGENADIENYPHQVSVRFSGSHICGGSIIRSDVVLTAAHCIISNLAASFSIRYGSTYVNSGKTVRAKRLNRHEDYNPNTFDNDVALIHLAQSVVFGSNAQPIALASQPPASGTNAIVTGWGTTSEGGSTSSVLQKVDVPIVEQSECRRQYSDRNITENMICAGVESGGKDACQGDSGGPLIIGNQIVGVVSWGYGCARPNFSGIYARVNKLNQWIVNNMN